MGFHSTFILFLVTLAILIYIIAVEKVEVFVVLNYVFLSDGVSFGAREQAQHSTIVISKHCTSENDIVDVSRSKGSKCTPSSDVHR